MTKKNTEDGKNGRCSCGSIVTDAEIEHADWFEDPTCAICSAIHFRSEWMTLKNKLHHKTMEADNLSGALEKAREAHWASRESGETDLKELRDRIDVLLHVLCREVLEGRGEE